MSEPRTIQPDAGQLTLRYDGNDYQGRMSAREVSAVLGSRRW